MEMALHYVYHGWRREKYKNLQHKRETLGLPSVQRSYGIRLWICKLNICGSSYSPVVGSWVPKDALQCGEILGQLRDYRIFEDVSKIEYLFMKCVTYITSNHRTAVNSDWGINMPRNWLYSVLLNQRVNIRPEEEITTFEKKIEPKAFEVRCRNAAYYVTSFGLDSVTFS
jgi:hypothetical protein